MTNLGAEEKELLRHAVIECLAARHPAALPVAGITRRVAGELDFAVAQGEVTASLVILQDKGLVRYQLDELGSSQWWCATAAGVLHVERGPAQPPQRHD
jgi:hypothetical protein